MSSLKWLALGENFWMLLLFCYALATLVALVHGQATGNAYALRSVVQVAGSMFRPASRRRSSLRRLLQQPACAMA